MKTITVLMLSVGLVAAFDMTEDQERNLNLSICPAFTLEACLPERIRADSAMSDCKSNSDCDIEKGLFCCPSKCSGFKCLKSEPRIAEGCPSYSQAKLTKCQSLEYSCTGSCKCCVDVDSCSRKCIE